MVRLYFDRHRLHCWHDYGSRWRSTRPLSPFSRGGRNYIYFTPEEIEIRFRGFPQLNKCVCKEFFGRRLRLIRQPKLGTNHFRIVIGWLEYDVMSLEARQRTLSISSCSRAWIISFRSTRSVLLYSAIWLQSFSIFPFLWPPFWLANPGIKSGTDFIGNSHHCSAG